MKRLSVLGAAAFAMAGIAMNANADTLTFTVVPGTANCGGAGLTTAPAAPFSGEIDSDVAGTTKISDLGLGCLYFGGGNGTVIAGGKIPDGSTSTLDVVTGQQLNKCAAGKVAAAGKKAKCLLGLESKESKKAVAADPIKVQKCKDKLTTTFNKLETKPPCVTSDDEVAIEAKIDAFEVDVAHDIAGIGEPPAISKCDAAKIAAAGKAAKCLLGLESKALKKGLAPDPLKVQKCKDKLIAAYGKADLKPPCTNAVAAATTQADIDAMVDDVVGELSPNLVGSAGPNSNACLVGAGPGLHCANNNATPVCANDAGCGGTAGSCALDANCFFGPPLPIVSPAPFAALTTCVLNVVQTTATGFGDITSGSTSISLPLSSRVYITGNSASPCPKCIAGTCDATWKTGTAAPSPDSGGVCVAVGAQLTSNSCRPSLPGFQAPLAVSLSPLTTGTTAITAADGKFCNPAQNPGAFGKGTAQRVEQTGSPAGDLSDNAPHNSHLGSAFCIPATGAVAVDGVADLPGPGAFSLNGNAQLVP